MLRGLLIALVAFAALVPATAGAQESPLGDESVLQTCRLYQLILSTGGETLVTAATELGEFSAPNPGGIDDALATIIEAEDSQSADEGVLEAYSTLDDYYGGICEGIDQCLIVQAIGGDDQALAQEAAEVLRDLNRPNPPGIGIAFQGITDPETDPDDYAQFRAQITDYFAGACSDDNGENEDTDGGANAGGSLEGDGDDDDGYTDDETGTNDDTSDAAGDDETDDDEPGANYVSDGTSIDTDTATSSGGSSTGTATLPNTGFGTVGLFLAFMAFVAFTLGATLITASDRG